MLYRFFLSLLLAALSKMLYSKCFNNFFSEKLQLRKSIQTCSGGGGVVVEKKRWLNANLATHLQYYFLYVI